MTAGAWDQSHHTSRHESVWLPRTVSDEAHEVERGERLGRCLMLRWTNMLLLAAVAALGASLLGVLAAL